MQKMFETLEFDKVLAMLAEYALAEKVRTKIMNLRPYRSEAEVSRHLQETTASKVIIGQIGNPPLSAMSDLETSLSVLGKGSVLLPEQLTRIAQFLTACRRMKGYLKKAEYSLNEVALYGKSIHDLAELEEEINRTIRVNEIDDHASPALANIRRKITDSHDQIKAKLDSLLRKNQNWFSESFIAIRNSRSTLPVKREFKNQVSGTVIDVSQSGSTYFIEPSQIRKIQEELSSLHIEEETEIQRILCQLTSLVEEYLPLIILNIEIMEALDFVFAKAKLSIAMNATAIPVSAKREIIITAGRHPLLKTDTVIPLDFRIGNDTHGIVITGPNTGGKTVALKTVGLLSLMAQSGLHAPAAGGHFTINNYVLCDIGDGQSITENLSTFSSHLTNIIEILKTADEQSLVLLDELGSGTDPTEGMGIAVAVLEELIGKKCLFLATTHYPEIKEFAKAAPGLLNAKMAFDREKLLPLFRLEIGEAGESCALYIAQRLGLPPKMIERATRAAYGIRSKSPQIHSLPADLTLKPQLEAIQKQNAEPITKPESKDTPGQSRRIQFNIGDSVVVYPQQKIGIVYQKADERGQVGVQIQKQKLLVNHKRLKLRIPASELYPENYDFSIIFDSVEVRKARHDMARKHDQNLIVEISEEERR